MQKHEFEKMYGKEVTLSIYVELERLYMADESGKAGFVVRCIREGLVEKIALKKLALVEEEAKDAWLQLERIRDVYRMNLQSALASIAA